MFQKRAYDLPTRLFHWSFAFLILFSLGIAKLVDDESSLYAYHMMSGLLMTGILVLRVIWGFLGSPTSRWGHFTLHPLKLKNYFQGILKHQANTWLGHNPASSWGTVVMFVCGFGLFFTGLLMTSKGFEKEFFEEFHELFANIIMLTIVAHIAGVMLHQLRHKDWIILSMITGHKRFEDDSKNKIENIEIKHRPITAVVFIIFIVVYANYLKTQYNPLTGHMNFFGRDLKLADGAEDNTIKSNSTNDDGDHDD